MSVDQGSRSVNENVINSITPHNPINCTGNLNSSDDSVNEERSNPPNEELKNIGKRNLNINSNQNNCTNNLKVTSNDFIRAESLDAILDIYDDLDLCNKISNFYRLIDLCKATDKITISQEFLRKLCNDMVPNSFKSISEINYSSLNSRSLGFVGIYGNRETIARYLLKKNAIDERIHDLLMTNDDENSGSMCPHLKPGIYLLVENEYGFVIHWPEK
ncbi:17152_t:CDS:2, partial [Acaulospora morrowiae]